MRAFLLRATGLAVIYLLVLTSLALGDLLIGSVLGLAVAYALRPRHASKPARLAPAPARIRFGAAAGVLAETAVEMVRGSWRVARFCLGASANPGLVEIPRGERSSIGVGLWGVLTGEAPDEVPVDVDETRDVLIVHLVDARDAEAVRARHARSHQRWQSKVVS
jgi:multisubunit Na+/H+ antiporter MnhE subunit